MRILSYNVSWKNMTGVYSEIAQKNVAFYIDSLSNLDFIVLQEASNYNRIIQKSKTLKKMEYYVARDIYEDLLIFWNKKKFICFDKQTIHGPITPGRPYLMMFFQQKENNEIFCLTNVHFGHHKKETLFKLLTYLISKIPETLENSLDKISRIIFVGDFNNEISDISKYTIGNKIFYTSNKIDYTCCLPKLSEQFDNAIDTKNRIEQFPINYDLYASDHIPILFVLE